MKGFRVQLVLSEQLSVLSCLVLSSLFSPFVGRGGGSLDVSWGGDVYVAAALEELESLVRRMLPRRILAESPL